MIVLTPLDHFSIWGLHVPVHGVFLPLAFIVYFWLVLSKLADKDTKDIHRFIILFLFLSLLGGRIWYALFHGGWSSWTGFFTEPGLASAGVFFGGVLAFAIYLYMKGSLKADFPDKMDILAYYAPIPIVIYRIGCFIHQCCYGLPASPDLPWAVQYIGTEIIRHPTQLYYITHSIIAFSVLWYFFRGQKRFNGQVLLNFLLLYIVGRSIILFFRDVSGLYFWSHMILYAMAFVLLSAIWLFSYLVIRRYSVRDPQEYNKCQDKIGGIKERFVFVKDEIFGRDTHL